MTRDLELMEEEMSMMPRKNDWGNPDNIQGTLRYEPSAEIKYQEAIAFRCEALKRAVELCQHRSTMSTEEVIAVADTLLDWLNK